MPHPIPPRARFARCAALIAALVILPAVRPSRGDDPPPEGRKPAGLIFVRALYCGTEPGEHPEGLMALDPDTGQAEVTYPVTSPGDVSPDGRFVAYASQGGIWLYDTGGDRPVRRIFDRDGEPSWTDHGKSLVIAVETRPDTWETWRVDRGGGWVKLPIPDNLLVIDATPDGSWLAARDVGADSKHWGALILIRPDGTGARHLTEGSAARDLFSIFRFSPDGREIADVEVRTVSGVRTSRLFLVDLDGKNRRELPVALERGFTVVPAWSPDGSRLALGLVAPQTSAIAVVDRDGRNFRKLPLPPWPYFFTLCGWSR
jgi:Tol biopolymer transport system component